jgi:ferritin
LKVSAFINDLTEICLQDKDFGTHRFIHWYVP